MKKSSRLIFLPVVSVLSLTCCQKQSSSPDPIDENKISYDGINLYFNSSDSEINEFLNDFTHRNMRYDEYSVCSNTSKRVGTGTGFQKNWEAMGVTFQNSVSQVYGEDKFNMISSYLLTNYDQDDLGLIYNTPLVFEPAGSYASEDLYEKCGYSVPQGWPFPYWEHTVENVEHRGDLQYVNTVEFNFNDAGDVTNKNWTAINGSMEVKSTGYGEFSSAGNVSNFIFHRSEIDVMLKDENNNPRGIDTRYAPMIDMEIEYTGVNVKDYNIIFKVKGDDSWHRAPQSKYASTPNKNVNGYVHVRQFFDMYLFPEWNRKVITDLGVEFVAEDGGTCSITNGRINFMRPSPDTRQTNATFQFIMALYNYYSYTRDTYVLLRLINKARRAILYLTHALEGEKGLISIAYLYGHDGVSPHSVETKPNDRMVYHGIASGYWDLSVYPQYNLETNCYFYQALKAMAVLEKAVENEPSDSKEGISVKNRMPLVEERVYYEYDADSLNALANQVKANIEKPINPVKEDNLNTDYNAGDYEYQNRGGFYNPKTGRFVTGINEHTGMILDFGYTYLNTEVIACGIGTEEQRISIMNWIDGRRVVEGDDSKGDDIYFYEFAARANTKNCEDYMNFYTDENNAAMYAEGLRGKTYSRSVQNGGAIIAWSYYDVMARAQVLGMDNALKRLSEIKEWYKKVLAAGGESDFFYSTYYDNLEMEAMMENPDMRRIYRIQTNQSGSLGLDLDFIESIILVRLIPDLLFGMDASNYNDLQFTYNDNNRQSYFEVYNMKYGDAVYSIRSKKNIIQVFNISGVVNHNHTLTFKYKTTNPNLSVKANGEEILNKEYKDGYLHVTVPFSEVKVIFG